jgi:acyl-homoserine lactone acylase PvdQ
MKIVDGCTSTNVDVADMYAEKIVTKNDKLFYEYNSDYLSLKN